MFHAARQSADGADRFLVHIALGPRPGRGSGVVGDVRLHAVRAVFRALAENIGRTKPCRMFLKLQRAKRLETGRVQPLNWLACQGMFKRRKNAESALTNQT